MTTTYDNDPNHGPHMFLLLVLLLLFWFAVLFTGCYPDPTRENACYTPPGLVTNTLPEPDGGDGACESFSQVASTCAEAAALTLNVSVDFYPDPYTVGLHPDTDGGAWPPDVYERDAGYTAIYGQTWCTDRSILLASFDWSWLRARDVLCHEVGHAILGCTMGDHARLSASGYEAKANELNQRDLGY
jgi:hypothetical protein